MGTPAFAADILDGLAQHEDVICAYTQPDKVRSRGNKITPSPVKEAAMVRGIPVKCVSSFKDPVEVEELSALAPDVICVAAFGALLPKAVLDIPRLGCVNVHASLLPRWRGAAPVERAILAGDEEAGVCIMRMEEGLDTGPYCVRRRIPIQGMSAEALTDELATLGASALLTALGQMRHGDAKWIAQEGADATYARKIEKRELFLDPSLSAEENAAFVRASSGAHPAKCLIGSKAVRIMEARVAAVSPLRASGEAVFAEDAIILSCASGALAVEALKPDGKREMDARQFVQGYQQLREGVAWSAL